MAWSDLRGQSLSSINQLLGMKNQRKMQGRQNIADIGSQMMEQKFKAGEGEKERESAADIQAAADAAALERVGITEGGATERHEATIESNEKIAELNMDLQTDLNEADNEAALERLGEEYRLRGAELLQQFHNFEDGPIVIKDFQTQEDVLIRSPAEYEAYLQDAIARRREALTRLEAELNASGSNNDGPQVLNAFNAAREYVENHQSLWDEETDSWKSLLEMPREQALELAEGIITASGLDPAGHTLAMQMFADHYDAYGQEAEPEPTPEDGGGRAPGGGRRGIPGVVTDAMEGAYAAGDAVDPEDPFAQLREAMTIGEFLRALIGNAMFPIAELTRPMRDRLSQEEESDTPSQSVPMSSAEQNLFNQLTDLYADASPQERATIEEYMLELDKPGESREITDILSFIDRALGGGQQQPRSFDFNRVD